MDPQLLSQLTALVSVVLIDIVLAGDNAVVVGTVAAGLPAEQQRKVIVIGAALALVPRVLFALVATYLLQVIGLTLAGGLVLLWVAWRIWRELQHDREAAAARRAVPAGGPALAMAGGDAPAPAAAAPKGMKAKTFASAITQVAIADVSMSLDNVLAVAGAAREHPWIMMFGLALSIAMMAVAANYVAKLIDRYRWVAYIGLVIVLIVAVRMIWEGGHDVADAVAVAMLG